MLQEAPTKLCRSGNPTERPHEEWTAKQCTWEEPHQIAFQKLKDMLECPPVLQMPDFDKTFIVQVDALDFGIGVILLQEHPDGFFQVLYASKKLLR